MYIVKKAFAVWAVTVLLIPAFILSSVHGAVAWQKIDPDLTSRRLVNYKARPPDFYFRRNRTTPKKYNDRFAAYMSLPTFQPRQELDLPAWSLYRFSADAGSGLLGETDTCKTNEGPIPEGRYNNQLMDKRGGKSKTIRGWVWYLGNKECKPGEKKKRTELFIHSQDLTKPVSNAETQGCIKIGQGARSSLAHMNQIAFAPKKGTTEVYSVPEG